MLFRSEEDGGCLGSGGTASADGDGDVIADDLDSLQEPTCAICFCPFEEGDRIGVLENCAHEFHVECLRDWAQRKNSCPLCGERMGRPERGVGRATATNATNENDRSDE